MLVQSFSCSGGSCNEHQSLGNWLLLYGSERLYLLLNWADYDLPAKLLERVRKSIQQGA